MTNKMCDFSYRVQNSEHIFCTWGVSRIYEIQGFSRLFNDFQDCPYESKAFQGFRYPVSERAST